MKLIIHDLDPTLAKQLFPNSSDYCFITKEQKLHPCIGCFGCWVKTPGQCVLKDSYNNIGELFSKCEELIIISECYYGGFSPFVKAILDRGISYVHPYFIFKNKEMHHKPRYNHQFPIKAFFYGTQITEQEKITARNIVTANEINLNNNGSTVFFALTPDQLGELL